MSQNSLNAFDQPLQVELTPSRLLLSVLLLLYTLTAAAWLWVPLDGFVRLVLYGLLCGHCGYLYLLHCRPVLRSAVRALAWNSDGGWRIRCQSDEWLPASIVMPVFVSYRLVAVRFRVGRLMTRRVILVGDRIDRDDFRRLRVRLLQSAHGHRDRKKISGPG